MSSLEASLEKFLDALGALDRAVDSALDGRLSADLQDADTVEMVEDLEELRRDKSVLTAQLERLKSQNKTLEALSDDVNLRLDGAIEEIRTVLE